MRRLAAREVRAQNTGERKGSVCTKHRGALLADACNEGR